MKHTFKIIYPILFFFLFLLAGCEKFVSIPAPKAEIINAAVFENEATAHAAIRGIYIQMMSSADYAGGASSITNLCGLSSDEFTERAGTTERLAFYNNELNAQNLLVKGIWEREYKYIFYANSIVEGLENAANINKELKLQLTGEARFIRAFCYFNLVNLFGEIPLLLNSDYRITSVAAKTSADLVYVQIINDLLACQTLLSGTIDYGLAERNRPNRATALALLSNVYLYSKQWEKVVQTSTLIINDPAYKLEPDLSKVFLKNSSETIWALMPVVPGNNTYEGAAFIPATNPAWVSISPQLYSAFEDMDKRKTAWMGSVQVGAEQQFYPLKYKIRNNGQPLTEFSIVFRISQQFLNRAEAYANLNQLALAITDLDLIRQRAGIPLIKLSRPDISQNELLVLIAQERQRELFAEWGNRWFDLKRTGQANAALALIANKKWQAGDVFYPIPESEILANPNLSSTKIN